MARTLEELMANPASEAQKEWERNADAHKRGRFLAFRLAMVMAGALTVEDDPATERRLRELREDDAQAA